MTLLFNFNNCAVTCLYCHYLGRISEFWFWLSPFQMTAICRGRWQSPRLSTTMGETLGNQWERSTIPLLLPLPVTGKRRGGSVRKLVNRKPPHEHSRSSEGRRRECSPSRTADELRERSVYDVAAFYVLLPSFGDQNLFFLISWLTLSLNLCACSVNFPTFLTFHSLFIIRISKLNWMLTI